MCGRQSHAQARRAAGDGWITDGGDEKVLFAKTGGGGDGFVFVAENERNNCAVHCRLPTADCRIESSDALAKLLAQLFANIRSDQLDPCSCRGRGGGNGCGGEDETARPV